MYVMIFGGSITVSIKRIYNKAMQRIQTDLTVLAAVFAYIITSSFLGRILSKINFGGWIFGMFEAEAQALHPQEQDLN